MSYVSPQYRPSAVYNLEKPPLTNGLEQPNSEDDLEQAAKWCYRFGFAAIVLFYLALIGLIVYMAGDILHFYSDEVQTLSSTSSQIIAPE